MRPCLDLKYMADKKKILECSSQGDKRYSPFFTWVVAFGVRDSIENHYQKSKVFVADDGELLSPVDWKQAKTFQKPQPWGMGLPVWPEFKLPNGLYAPKKFHVHGWYSSLWLKHLDENKDLVEYAKTFDDYHDKFKGSFPLCQADCIRLYCKSGREALLETCKEFIQWLKSQSTAQPSRE